MQHTPDITQHGDLDSLDLTCPGCGADLLADPGYHEWRICSRCDRHFWMSARDRVAILAYHAQFIELPPFEPETDGPGVLQRQTPADRRESQRDRSALADALVTGRLTVANASAIVAVMDPVLLPTGLGPVTADKLIAAIETAVAERLPVVVFCGGGSLPPGTGLLTGIQPLRLAGAIAALHRAGLALIAVMTHPSSGTVLEAVGINADFRLAEPGTDLPDDARPDERIDRPALLGRLGDLIRLATDPNPNLSFLLSPESWHPEVAIRVIGSYVVVLIEVDSGAMEGADNLAPVRRGQRVASHLELPVVLSITGERPLPLQTQADLRDLMLRHRRPTVGILTGATTIANLNVLATDTVLGGPDLSIAGRNRRFGQTDALSAGIVDAVIGDDGDAAIARALDQSIRLSPARRFEHRLRTIERRGTDSAGAREEGQRELMDLRDMQAAFMRSVEDLRARFEAREFPLPSLPNMTGKPHLPQFHLPKLHLNRADLIEMRDKWVARRKAPGTPADGSDE
ncbi:MAG: hypothetical protein M3Y37_07670 [Chloroflexota bacterium]|nr:hypothetical protein [Chloroflexota bacterium]